MNNSFSLNRRRFVSATALVSLVAANHFQSVLIAAESSGLIPLNTTDDLILKGCKATVAEHLGRRALQLCSLPGDGPGNGGLLAMIPGVVFENGTIQVDLAGGPITGPRPGFLGLAFHIDEQMKKFEQVYLRPKNGRHEEQLHRNHACQYASQPDFGWKKLRDEFPGMYESYVDLEVDAWTKMKLDIQGTKLRLFVNEAAQPCLVVNDLKLGNISGRIALWIDADTRAFFRNLRVMNSLS